MCSGLTSKLVLPFTLKDITNTFGGQLLGDSGLPIHCVGSLKYAEFGAISFFNDTKYSEQLSATRASAIIIKPEHAELTNLPKILTDNPYAYFAKVSQMLYAEHKQAPGFHNSAIIDSTSHVPTSSSIGAHVVIGAKVQLGEGVVVGANVVIENDVVIGSFTKIEPNVTIKHGTQIGEYCHLFSGCVIGNDGFGYAEQEGKWVKIPQVGRVIIYNHVDVGANTTIDRGAIDDTIIEEGVKLDNLIQIAHNCKIGAHTVIAGCTGIAGSATIGRHCKIGGAAMILGHLTIADDVTISPGSMITRNINKAGTYTALMPFQQHQEWLKTAANIRHLSELKDKIRAIESELVNMKNISSK